MKYILPVLLLLCTACGGNTLSSVPDTIKTEAHTRLARHLGVSKSSLVLKHGEKHTWDTSALGCRSENTEYKNGSLDGYNLLFELNAKRYYTVNTADNTYILCSEGNKRDLLQ